MMLKAFRIPARHKQVGTHSTVYTSIDNHNSGYLGMVVQLYVQAHLANLYLEGI